MCACSSAICAVEWHFHKVTKFGHEVQLWRLHHDKQVQGSGSQEATGHQNNAHTHAPGSPVHVPVPSAARNAAPTAAPGAAILVTAILILTHELDPLAIQ